MLATFVAQLTLLRQGLAMTTAATPAPRVSALHPRILARLCAVPDLPDRLAQPNLPAVRQAAALFYDCLQELSSASGRDDAVADARALLAAVDGLRALRERRLDDAASHLLAAWSDQNTAAGRRAVDAESFTYDPAPDVSLEVAEVSALAAGTPWPSAQPMNDPEWLLTYHLACQQLMAEHLGAGRTRVALRSLMAHLDLGQDDLGRMFGVSGETVRRWERGQTRIPTAQEARVLAAEAALRRLLDLFKPERLASAVRRPAELFAGDTAHEWILRGRIDDVAERYETALSYQG
jgi:transcriptional regulator with XRE-family HTH domain